MGPGASAGAAAGLVGCSVFLVLHALWIVPIWFVAPVAYGIAAVAGAVFGDLLEHLGVVRRGAAVASLLALAAGGVILAPTGVLAELGFHAGTAPGLVVLAAFLLPAVGVGAGLGWMRGGSRNAAGSGALAGLLLAVGPGHTIPFLAGTAAVPLEMKILVVVGAAASVTFVVAGLIIARGAVPQSAGETTR